jgi:hypothetical protein
MDEVDIERANIVAIIKEKWDKKLTKEPKPEPKVWIKDKIDVTDIKVEPKLKPKKNEPKPKFENTLF